MKKIILILMPVLILLSSCATAEIPGSSYIPPKMSSELAKEISEKYGDLVFDNETPFDKMEISNVTELQYRACYPRVKAGTYSSFLQYSKFKDDFEHIYLRQNGDEIYAAAKIMYESEIYYWISILNPEFWLERTDGALIHEKLFEEKDFDRVKAGATTFKDISKIDKTVFLYLGSFVSIHRLKDGRLVYITYVMWERGLSEDKEDKDIIVKKILIREDENNFLDKLLPIDREAIT